MESEWTLQEKFQIFLDSSFASARSSLWRKQTLRLFPVLVLALPLALHAQEGLDSIRLHAQEDSVLIMRFGGDLLMAGHYTRASRGDASLAFEDFDLFQSDDISLVNLECPITDRGTKVAKPYNFRMPPLYTPALKKAGIEIVNLANNHIFDYGSEGLFDTISYLDSVGVHHVGAGRNALEARKPVLVRLKGHKVGFLGYYGGGEAPPATKDSPGVAPRNLVLITRDIAKLRSRDSADFVVVTLHWGTEKALQPDSGQVRFARDIIDAGGDAVIGHHPHVLQGIERYRRGIIAYSLGNFLFGGIGRPNDRTAILEIRLAREGREYSLIPVGLRNWHLTLLEASERDSVIANVAELSSMFPRSIFTCKENP
jgi:poly-gamma-glutamate capsule biosynthesis protein CapA/YwtB (metallophosphatase superfamily)